MVIYSIADLTKYLAIYLVSMVKFIGGPTIGTAFDLTFIEIVALTSLGMMTTVVLISLLGQRFRNWLNKIFRRDRKLFTKGNRRFVLFWKKYGLIGVSFLTPIVFSPILGTLLVNAFGGTKKQIMGYMFLSALFWSFTLTFFYDKIISIF